MSNDKPAASAAEHDEYLVLAHTKLIWLRPKAVERLEAGERVLALIQFDNGSRDWDTVWFDRSLNLWVLCESGGNVDGEVLRFARVEVPA